MINKEISFIITKNNTRIKLYKLLNKEKWVYLDRIIIEPMQENTFIYPELILLITSSDQFIEHIQGRVVEFKKLSY